MKRKTLFIIGGAIFLICMLAAGSMWYVSTQPLYKPGMVRTEKTLSAPLKPPAQPDVPDRWLVEPGIQLHHLTVGKGRDVLIVHGGPGLPFIQPMSGLEPLTDQFRFHYYDQRGCGASTRPIDHFESKNMYQNISTADRTLGLGVQIADIERIRRILGDDKLILLGHSWGGFLASLYAAEFPEHVEALILVSPADMLVMPQPKGEGDLFASVREGLPADQKAEYDQFMKDYLDFNSIVKKSDAELVAMNERSGRYYEEAVRFPYRHEQGQPGGWMVWAMYISMGQQHDYRADLKKVNAPVLVIHGNNDLQSEAASRTYVEAFPNAEFATIDNAGHFSFEDQPEQFASIVGTFLGNLK